jgi:hypothetical protein
LKKHSQIESVTPPLARVLNYGQCAALSHYYCISMLRVDKYVSGARVTCESNLSGRKNSTQFSQRGQTHDRVADPGWHANDDAFDLLWLSLDQGI